MKPITLQTNVSLLFFLFFASLHLSAQTITDYPDCNNFDDALTLSVYPSTIDDETWLVLAEINDLDYYIHNVIVRWGDGAIGDSPSSTSTPILDFLAHTYDTPGEYEICVEAYFYENGTFPCPPGALFPCGPILSAGYDYTTCCTSMVIGDPCEDFVNIHAVGFTPEPGTDALVQIDTEGDYELVNVWIDYDDGSPLFFESSIEDRTQFITTHVFPDDGEYDLTISYNIHNTVTGSVTFCEQSLSVFVLDFDINCYFTMYPNGQNIYLPGPGDFQIQTTLQTVYMTPINWPNPTDNLNFRFEWSDGTVTETTGLESVLKSFSSSGDKSVSITISQGNDSASCPVQEIYRNYDFTVLGTIQDFTGGIGQITPVPRVTPANVINRAEFAKKPGSNGDENELAKSNPSLSTGLSTVSEINIYPNPSNGAAKIELLNANQNQEIVSVSVFDVQGKLLQEKSTAGISELDLVDLPAGMKIISMQILHLGTGEVEMATTKLLVN